MIDPITAATQRARGSLPGVPDLPPAPNLPIDTNPEIAKQKAKAEILKRKIEIDKKKLEAKEKVIREAKEKLKSLPFPSLKALQDKLIARLEKQLAEERAAIAKSNIDKAAEVHRYPIRQLKSQQTLADAANGLPTLPDRSNLPGVPAIPRPPQLPSAPTIPKLPLR
jgi:hypothetical protein